MRLLNSSYEFGLPALLRRPHLQFRNWIRRLADSDRLSDEPKRLLLVGGPGSGRTLELRQLASQAIWSRKALLILGRSREWTGFLQSVGALEFGCDSGMVVTPEMSNAPILGISHDVWKQPVNAGIRLASIVAGGVPELFPALDRLTSTASGRGIVVIVDDLPMWVDEGLEALLQLVHRVSNAAHDSAVYVSGQEVRGNTEEAVRQLQILDYQAFRSGTAYRNLGFPPATIAMLSNQPSGGSHRGRLSYADSGPLFWAKPDRLVEPQRYGRAAKKWQRA